MKISDIPDSFLMAILNEAERAYPEECCGFILGSADQPKSFSQLRPCRNLQNLYHQHDPENFPRTAESAYFVDPKELLLIQKEARLAKEAIRIIYHSHIDGASYFSEEDCRMAAPDGDPVYPGVDYLVVSVMKGKARGYHLFHWDPLRRDFQS